MLAKDFLKRKEVWTAKPSIYKFSIWSICVVLYANCILK